MSNKWKALPPLNEGRSNHASLLLENLKAFCFCGLKKGEPVDSIESIEIETGREWSILAVSVAQTHNFAAV